MTIAEFLNARLDEDEFAAKQSPYSDWAGRQRGSLVAKIVSARGAGGTLTQWYLADIAAKRAIIALHTGEKDEPCQSWAGNYTYEPCATLKALASVYADHADYNSEWKP